MHVPSHILYADYIMLFCKGNSESIKSIHDLINRYAAISSQNINQTKSILYTGAMIDQRQSHTASLLGFSIGTLPFLYLGVPMFKDKPKSRDFQFIADKIRLKLAAWKASLLSISGRNSNGKISYRSMMMHTILIYSWPVSIIKYIEKWIRNFIWSGDVNKRKMVTVSWFKCCNPTSEGGLGIRSLSKLNEATNVKLCWDMINSEEQWYKLIRSRVLRGDRQIQHHIYSCIWSGMKHCYIDVYQNIGWLIGYNSNVNFWNDDWYGQPISDYLNLPEWMKGYLKAHVKDFIHNNQWHIPNALQRAFPNLLIFVNRVHIPDSGKLSLKLPYEIQTPSTNHTTWGKLIWNSSIPPSLLYVICALSCQLMIICPLEVLICLLFVICALSNQKPLNILSLAALMQ